MQLEVAKTNICYDYVEFYDGATESSSVLGKICTQPRTITSFGSSMLVVFQSDWSINTGGFSLRWKFVSGGGWNTGPGQSVSTVWNTDAFDVFDVTCRKCSWMTNDCFLLFFSSATCNTNTTTTTRRWRPHVWYTTDPTYRDFVGAHRGWHGGSSELVAVAVQRLWWYIQWRRQMVSVRWQRH